MGATGIETCGAAGTRAPYDACTAAGECPVGHDCIGGTCKPYCASASSTCPGSRAACRPITSNNNPIPNAYYCTRTCNPVNPQQEDATFDACGTGLACSASTDGVSDCYGPPTPAGTAGAACTGSRDCAVGHYCAATNICYKWCRVGTGATDCPSGTLCQPFNTPQFAASIEYGACVTCVPPAGAGRGTCDTTPQCGCRSTENCDVTNVMQGTTACGTAGTAMPFHSCNSTTRCQVGYSCIGGVCSPFCENASAVCPGVNARCLQASSGGTPVPGYFYCTRTCNPVNPQQDDATYDACGPSVNCMPSATRDSDCVSGSTPSGTQGANCVGTNGQADNSRCAVGHFCRQPTTGVFQCTRFCTYPGGACGTGFTCTPFGNKLYAGPNEIGACIAGSG